MSKFFQAFYTSCEKGLAGSKGFQFKAASPELDSRLLQKLEPLCTYVPPSSLPSQPSLEQLKDFPVSLIFSQLPGIGYFLAQIKYVGKDYSGRYGNYFVHALVSQDNMPFGDFLPIEIWNSAIWTNEQEEKESPSIKLSSLLAQNMQIEPGSTELKNFLHQNDRLSHLSKLMAAVLDSFTSHRPIVIIDYSHNVALWIAALTHALPRNFALQLTFNTYVANPRQADFRIMGLSPHNDPKFSSIELNHQYFVFDFVKNEFSHIEKVPAFAKSIAHLYNLGSDEAVGGFNKYLTDRKFNITSVEQLDPAIFAYLCLFKTNLTNIDDFDINLVCELLESQLESFDSEAVKNFFVRLKSEGQFDRALLKSCTNLYRAAQKLDDRKVDLKITVQRLYIEWIFQEALVKCQPGDFIETWKGGIPLSETAVQKAREYKNEWREIFSAVKNTAPFKMFDLLYVQERFQLLTPKDLLQVFEEDVAPQLADPVFLKSFKDLVAGTTNPAELKVVLQGISPYFAKRMNDSNVGKILDQLCASSPAVAAEFESYAEAQNNFEFYKYLVRVKASKDANKTDFLTKRFDELVDRQVQFIPQLFDYFVETLKININAPEVMIWFRCNLGKFDNILYVAFVEKLFSNAARQQSFDQKLLDACTDLYNLALHLAEKSAIRRKVELLYLSWLVKGACRQIKPENLIAALEKISLGKPPAHPDAEWIREWINQLETLEKTETDRLIALLKLGSKLGFLSQSRKKLVKIGEEIIGPMLEDKTARDVIKKLADKDFEEKKLNEDFAWNSILNGVGTYISREYKSRNRLLEQLRDSTAVRAGLKNFAASNRQPQLLLGLVEYEVSSKPDVDKIFCFNDNIKHLAQLKDGSRDDTIDRFFDIFWKKEQLDIGRALDIARTLENAKLCTKAIFDRLHGTLTTKLEAYGFEWSHFELARLLLVPPFNDFSGSRVATMLEAITAIDDIKRGDDYLDRAIRCFENLQKDKDTKDTIVDFDKKIAVSLVRMNDDKNHAKYLAELNRIIGKKFLSLYASNAKDFLQNKRGSEKIWYIAQFFQIWTNSFSNDPSGFDELLKATLSEKLSDDEEKSIANRIEPQLRDSWDKFFKRTQGGLAKKIWGTVVNSLKSSDEENNLQEVKK